MDGTAEPAVSRDQIFRGERRKGKIVFSFQLTASRICSSQSFQSVVITFKSQLPTYDTLLVKNNYTGVIIVYKLLRFLQKNMNASKPFFEHRRRSTHKSSLVSVSVYAAVFRKI